MCMAAISFLLFQDKRPQMEKESLKEKRQFVGELNIDWQALLKGRFLGTDLWEQNDNHVEADGNFQSDLTPPCLLYQAIPPHLKDKDRRRSDQER